MRVYSIIRDTRYTFLDIETTTNIGSEFLIIETRNKKFHEDEFTNPKRYGYKYTKKLKKYFPNVLELSQVHSKDMKTYFLRYKLKQEEIENNFYLNEKGLCKLIEDALNFKTT